MMTDQRSNQATQASPVRRDAAGRVDVPHLLASVEAGRLSAFIREWLAARLRGSAQHLPLDVANEEAPHQVFVDLWLDVGPGSAVRDALAWACARLLEEAESTPDEDWVGKLLRLISSLRPQGCRSLLFSRARALLAAEDDAVGRRWAVGWLAAAAAYPEQTPEMLAAWRANLGHRRYQGAAWAGLLHSLGTSVPYLPLYWEGRPAAKRHHAIRGAVGDFVRRRPAAEVRAALLRHQTILADTPGLIEALDEALVDAGVEPLSRGVLTIDGGRRGRADDRHQAAAAGGGQWGGIVSEPRP